MDRTPLTVFAPIDKSLHDLLAKSKSRQSINLIELAKHHIGKFFVFLIIARFDLVSSPSAASHRQQQQQLSAALIGSIFHPLEFRRRSSRGLGLLVWVAPECI